MKEYIDLFIAELTTPPPRPSEMNGRELTGNERIALAIGCGAHIDFEMDGTQLRASTREKIGIAADPYADKWMVTILAD